MINRNQNLEWLKGFTESLNQRDAYLHEKDQMMAVILHSLVANVFVQDQNLRFVWVYNPAPGFEASSLLGKTDLDFLPAEEAETIMEIKRRVLMTGESEHVECAFTVGDESLIFEIAVGRLTDSGGEVTGVCGISRDVTHDRK